MSYYAVTRNAGLGWADGKGAFEQPRASDHAAFMNSLADEGLILFAGPLAGTEHERIRVLLIADAPTEADVRRRLADDPWEIAETVVTATIEPWSLFVGTQRLTAAQTVTL